MSHFETESEARAAGGARARWGKTTKEVNMSRKNRVETVLDRHYRDMLELNRKFIETLGRPRVQYPNSIGTEPPVSKKLSKKQLQALAKGRKVLSLKRANTSQI